MVPGNNSTIEPEIWRHLPPDMALYASRLMLKGDVTVDNLKNMEREVDRAAAELMATRVDILLIADMVVSFIMEPGWNERRAADMTARFAVPCHTGWTALRAALRHLAIARFVTISPYPRHLQALAKAFFAHEGFELVDEHTFDVADMLDIPLLPAQRIRDAAAGLDRRRAQAIVIMSTDVPTFDVIEPLEREFGLPVLTQNQTLLWSAIAAAASAPRLTGLGRLLAS